VNIFAYSIRRPLPAILFSIVALLLGWISFNKLPITHIRASTFRSSR
jgi:multidrug efflux pump subunit AcrB